jgi:curved DNA-binding protein CbpA
MTTEEPDHYATLQVAPSAEPAVIAAAYRALARRYHPDVAGGEGEAMMRRLNAAWEVLGDPERRAAYDRRRAERARAAAASRPEARADHAPQAGPIGSDGRSAPGPTAEPGPYGPAGPPPGRPSGSVLPFGPFRGWSLGEIARVDPGYLEWLEGKREGRPYLREIEAILRAIGWRRPSGAEVRTRRPARRWRFGRG